jgi:hypothetical protein
MVGLKINEKKTKYMKCKRNTQNTRQILKIGNYAFEEVNNFNYLGVKMNSRKENNEELKEKILKGNRAYYTNKHILKNNHISKNTKMRIYKSLIRPVITYAAETMCFTKQEEEQLRILERKILRSILGPKRTSEGEYRPKMNHELLKEIGGEDIVRFIKAQRIKWLGHIIRTKENANIKTITKWRPHENRPRGRPKARWWGEVTEDLRTMKISRWREKAKDRKLWRKIVTNTKSNTKL